MSDLILLVLAIALSGVFIFGLISFIKDRKKARVIFSRHK
ncbi:small membrane protein [Shimwellia pseudoproteus]|nr:small membrane protein [Shimwellia pseudoproteus]